MFLRYGYNTVLFPGDMPTEGMLHLLSEKEGVQKRFTRFAPNFKLKYPLWHEKTSNQPSLKQCHAKYGISVLIASHHGLESGYSPELYRSMKGGKPGIVLISEKKHKTVHNGSVDSKYRSSDGAQGRFVNVEGKSDEYFSYSTANDEHILIKFDNYRTPDIYAEARIERLLEK